MSSLVSLLRAVAGGSILVVVYTNLVYPLVVGVLGTVAGRWSDADASAVRTDATPDLAPNDADTDEVPTVSLIVAAYNEEDIIADKIRNSLELSYPDDALEIVVFSDGSTDSTDEVVRSFADDGVELVRVEGRVGKTECQNVVAERANGEILVFSDANSMYEPDAVSRLVGQFDDGVGCVVGGLHYENEGENTEGIPIYRRIERFVQRSESRLGSVVKGNGAIYAVRADDYVRLAPDLMSDFAEPLAIRSAGKRVKFAPEAVAREMARNDLDSQRSAENRITTRSWHTLSQFTELLNPLTYGLYSVKLWSRTVLLWLTPVFLGTASVAIVALAVVRPTAVHMVLLGGPVAFGLSLGVVSALRARGWSAPLPLQVAYYFGLLNYSLLVGLYNFVRDRNVVTWDTDERASN